MDVPNIIKSLDAHLKAGKISQIIPKLTGPLVRQAQRERLGLVHAVMRMEDRALRAACFRDLVHLGANINAPDLKNVIPLHAAVELYDLDGIDLLLSFGADFNIQDDKGRTPLHFCAMTGRIRPATRLITAGADTTLRDDAGMSFMSLGDRNFFEHIDLFLDIRKTMSNLTVKLLPYEEPTDSSKSAYARARDYASDDLMSCGD